MVVADAPYTNDAIAALRAALGDDGIDLDPARRHLVAQDVFNASAPALAIVAPRSAEQVCAIVGIARAHGLHVVPRGGGASYTSGYLSADPDKAILLDMTAMDRIVSISAEDMYVVVEPGCTWAALYAALAPLGLRPPFWGTMSGLRATIGGSIAQNAIFWGSGTGGSAADSVIGVEVVTGSGAILRTGSLGVKDAVPFFRHFGPDLTGLFTADAGALGIKTRIVLRLVRSAAADGALSFAIPDHDALTTLMSEIGRTGIAAEQMGLDVRLKSARMASEGLFADLGHLIRLVRGARSWRRGIADALRVIRAGRGFIDDCAFSAHIFLEGDNDHHVAALADRVRAIAAPLGAIEVEASIPRMMTATPFTPLNGVLGPKGERWVPVHCVVPHSAARQAYEAIAAIFAEHRPLLARHSIEIGYLFTTIGTSAFVIEPMFLWPDALHALHRDILDPGRLARYPERPNAPEARAAVATVRAAISAAVDALGALHIQLGRYYEYRARLDSDTATFVTDLRRTLDPDDVINPGTLR